MNIASFLQPKIDVAFLRDEMTIEQGLEELRHSGYSAIPVIDREDRYVGGVSEGDFLWKILDEYSESKSLSGQGMVRDIIRLGRVKAVCIDTDMEDLIDHALHQNFVPVVDDRNIFIGIVTRRDIIDYYTKRQNNG